MSAYVGGTAVGRRDTSLQRVRVPGYGRCTIYRSKWQAGDGDESHGHNQGMRTTNRRRSLAKGGPRYIADSPSQKSSFDISLFVPRDFTDFPFPKLWHLKARCSPRRRLWDSSVMDEIRTAIVIVLAFVPYSTWGQRPAHSVAPGRNQAHVPSTHLLQHADGLTIIAAALKLRSQLDTYDCSHLVHVVYKRAGFPYRYATAAQLYAGVGEFRRVTNPQPGDLVTFPEKGKNGHVGIMVSPTQHLFFSALTHTGPGVSSYASPYWKARGAPHFFRYIRQFSSRRHRDEVARLSGN
jgi:hypothetical protein